MVRKVGGVTRPLHMSPSLLVGLGMYMQSRVSGRKTCMRTWVGATFPRQGTSRYISRQIQAVSQGLHALAA